jgi:transcriptional regulator with XRE-family HTH domain
MQMQDWRAVLGKNVGRVRERKAMTQEQLAFEAEIDLTYLNGIERGRRNPSLMVMARIADALSVALSTLVDPGKKWPSANGANSRPTLFGAVLRQPAPRCSPEGSYAWAIPLRLLAGHAFKKAVT